jgi:hypothetical protein
MHMRSDDAEGVARRRAGAKLGFYIHLVAYVVVNCFLVAINLTYTPQRLWFFWPLLGWGIGIVFHAIFGLGAGSAMRERMVQREAERIRSDRS